MLTEDILEDTKNLCFFVSSKMASVSTLQGCSRAARDAPLPQLVAVQRVQRRQCAAEQQRQHCHMPHNNMHAHKTPTYIHTNTGRPLT